MTFVFIEDATSPDDFSRRDGRRYVNQKKRLRCTVFPTPSRWRVFKFITKKASFAGGLFQVAKFRQSRADLCSSDVCKKAGDTCPQAFTLLREIASSAEQLTGSRTRGRGGFVDAEDIRRHFGRATRCFLDAA